jgi:transcriptional regulator with XRE-family HTH domain
MDLAKWVRQARAYYGEQKGRKVPQRELGEIVGCGKANISAWETGKHRPNYDQILAISKITGYPPPIPAAAPLVDEPNPEYVGRVEIFVPTPVVGTAKVGEDGFFEELGYPVGQGDGFVEHNRNRDRGAYALRIRGDSMYPAIRNGWYVVIEPSGAPQEDEYVLIKLKDGRKMVKELRRRTRDTVIVESVNGGARMTIATDDIDEISPVANVLPPSKWKPE